MKCDHDNLKSLRSVNPENHPEVGVIAGGEPENKEEPAWCPRCGSLWAMTGFGWTWLSPASDRSAPTLMNIMREEDN